MVIGIDASRAFLKKRTGIEEYSYQVIRHLRTVLPGEAEVILYLRRGQTIDFKLPSTWKIKSLWAPRLWTQGRLSLEMLLHRPDVLFVPAHTVPFIHPKRTVVTIHGLEYEFCPEGYGFFERIYMRLSILHSCWTASRVVAVSENTKRDLLQLYRISEKKIQVIHEGFQPESLPKMLSQTLVSDHSPYLLFVGRLETRKNLIRILEAFEQMKEKLGTTHQLILAGKFGYGYQQILQKIHHSKWKQDILAKGYISEAEKWNLLRRASLFLFPTLYEGFGIPVLEAQSVGIPVLTSNISSLPEIAGAGAIFVDPTRTESLRDGIILGLTDESLRAGIIEAGSKNVRRFHWEGTARLLADCITQAV